MASAHRHYIPGYVWHITHRCHKREFLLKSILIDYETLSYLSGYNNFEDFQMAHRRWVESSLSKEQPRRQARWTQSVATGSESFVQRQLGAMAMGRRVQKKAEDFELRESESFYNALFDTKKDDIDRNSVWLWQ